MPMLHVQEEMTHLLPRLSLFVPTKWRRPIDIVDAIVSADIICARS
jgi:hypothetical protein